MLAANPGRSGGVGLLSELIFDKLPVAFAVLFFCGVTAVCLSNAHMFTKRHGRRHALCGLLYLCLLLVGLYGVVCDGSFSSAQWLYYDTLLGVLGVFLTLAAAYDFGHKNVVNVASGTLDEHATVTFDEMIEHSFYQALNLVQVLFLHVINPDMSLVVRMLAALATTLPWVVRGVFPTNRFSDNYTKHDAKSTALVRLLYRIKKYQYVFYKHFLLHGLNLTVAMYGYERIPCVWSFRLYWMLITTSYVMEFFLQTLVKKNYMSQSTMLFMQKTLMLASSCAAIHVLLLFVSLPVSLFSMALNFLYRGHEPTKIACISLFMLSLHDSGVAFVDG